MDEIKKVVPQSLRIWFVIHFVVDILFALPLLFFPEALMGQFGWTVTDPVMPRLVGAALLGIGTESLLGRNASVDVFRAMLNLKVIWAAGAVLAIGLGLANAAPPAAWLFLGIFAGFLAVWSYYWLRLR